MDSPSSSQQGEGGGDGPGEDPLLGNRLSDLLDCALGDETPVSGSGAWEPPDEEELKRILPGYQVVTMLGRGGMGVVYEARDLVLETTVAIKLLPRQLAADDLLMARFKKEARILRNLDHPGIVKVHSFTLTPDGYAYFVMDHVAGPTVHDLVRSGRLTAKLALKLVIQICRALQYLHEQGVIHRDIKPTNILVDGDGNARLVDFGIAGSVSANTLGLTLTGQTPGTPFYVAPEIYNGQPPTPSSDVYSLGVTLYEMLTGERPHIQSPPPSSVHGVNRDIDRVVFRALNRKPSGRYQSAESLRRDLQRCMRHIREIRMAWMIGILTIAIGVFFISRNIDVKRKAPASPVVASVSTGVPESAVAEDPPAEIHPLDFPAAEADDDDSDPFAPVAAIPGPQALSSTEDSPSAIEADPTEALRESLTGHTWSYEDSLFPNAKENMPRNGVGKPIMPIRFFPNGKFHDRWKWNYWIVGPRTVHIQYWDPVYDPKKVVVLTFSEDLTTYAGSFKDGKGNFHEITGTRVDPIP